MHFAHRAYVLIVLTATLAVAGLWSSDPALWGVWRIPAVLLLLGLAGEGWFIRRAVLTADVETASRAFLGRAQPAAFAFSNRTSRPIPVEFAPVVPAGCEPLGSATRQVLTPAGGQQLAPFSLLAIQLGPQSWPVIPVRLLGPLQLAWWSRELQPTAQLCVAPDTVQKGARRPRGAPAGARSRQVVGAGQELHQLRRYVPGDPPARIDWKATARAGRLITREFSEDQRLDVVVAIDAGRFSRVRTGAIDRFGLYANIASRLAELVVPNDDRVGLLVFADRTLAVNAPDRGVAAVARMRRSLEQLSVQSAEADPVAAAVALRGMLKHRTLIVMLTDLDDASTAEQLARAVRLLSPPHLVLLAASSNAELTDLAQSQALSWKDPWVSLAAVEHESRAHSQRALLRRLGAPVIAVREDLLERRVLAEYEWLRRARRI